MNIPHKFALIGVAGYIAPRHLKAIHDTGHEVVAALDPHDSVGLLDTYFPNAHFFTEFERFDRHVEKTRHGNDGVTIDYVSICSPNYLHDAHIRFALRVGANAICEKPLVLNPWNIDALSELEKEYGKRIYTVLQLRVHPLLRELKEKISRASTHTAKYNVDLTYVTSRGRWYLSSWKNNIEKSGGLATNIGIHFFDLLIWLFGAVQAVEVHTASPLHTSGYLELQRARVRWFLSIDGNDLPASVRSQNKKTYRQLTLDGSEVEFSEGFTDLHTVIYREIFAGDGFGLSDAKPSIALAHQIRTSTPKAIPEHAHPYLQQQAYTQ